MWQNILSKNIIYMPQYWNFSGRLIIVFIFSSKKGMNYIFQQFDVANRFFVFLFSMFFHVVLYRRQKENKIEISLAVFFFSQTVFQQFDILICFQDSSLNP